MKLVLAPIWLWLGRHLVRELLEGLQVALVVALDGGEGQRLMAEALDEEGRVMGGHLVGRWPEPMDHEFDADCGIHQRLGEHFPLVLLVPATGGEDHAPGVVPTLHGPIPEDLQEILIGQPLVRCDAESDPVLLPMATSDATHHLGGVHELNGFLRAGIPYERGVLQGVSKLVVSGCPR